MTNDDWVQALRQYLTAVRASDPVPARSELSLPQEVQCRILGGHLISWLDDWGPQLLAERNALAITRGATERPLVVFLTDKPGLVAAHQILGGSTEDIVYCRSSEFAAFPQRTQDDAFGVHCELHSYFDGPRDAEVARRARAEHPPKRGEELWLHYDCSVMGPLFARGAHHLWLWNGREPRMLEEAWSTWVS